MSKADQIFKESCLDILNNGYDQTGENVRPRWQDGTPAYTIKRFGLVNRYDLREEFPILTLRPINFRAAVDELLWIWQKKSNRISDLNSHIWDSWADEQGTIGKAYGFQLAQKHQYPEGDFDQVDRVIYDLKHNPASRRIITNLYNHADLHAMQLYPCAYSLTFNVSGKRLDALLHQRSQDMLVANGWNVTQYACLQHMLAQVCGLEAGELVHVIADAHIYDRHVPLVRELLKREAYPAPQLVIDRTVSDFYAFTLDSLRLENYQHGEKDGRYPGGRMNETHAGELRLTPVLSAVVAVDQAWGIGWHGQLLFHAREDMRRFRALTSGHTVIYGRKTLETFPQAKPLPNRTNIILTRQADLDVPGAAIARSLEELHSMLVRLADPAVFVIGGASVYRQLLPFCQQAYVSQFVAELPADSFFPDLDRLSGWQLAEEEPVVCAAVDLVGQSRTIGIPLRFCRYSQTKVKSLAALIGKAGDNTER